MSGPIVQLSAGATEADIQSALNKMSSGGTLILAANTVIQVTKGIDIDGSKNITLDLNGSTLQQAADVYTLSVNGRMTAGASATIGHDNVGHSTVAYDGASKVSVGDYVKIYSDDLIPNDQGALTRLGQAMKVVAVNGNSLTLEGDLLYANLYQTNVRASQYLSGQVEIKNGVVRGDQSHPDWQDPLVSVRSTIGTHIDGLTVRDGNSMAINFVSSVNGLVTQSSVINLTDDTPNGHYGYGVHSASSVGTTVDGLYAEKVRHAVDDNATGLTATHVDPSKYGADIGLTASNVVVNSATSFAFSWHSEGRGASYSDSVVYNSFGVLGGRGTDNAFKDISGAGNNRGILFFEYGDGDGARITVNNINLKENSGYAYFKQNDPSQGVLSNSSFEVLSNKVTIAPNDSAVSLINNVLKVGAFTTDETINGTSAVDRLLGGLGVDVINGGAGNDYIWGGDQADILTGGEGRDRFAYLSIGERGDTITDFKAGANGDFIDLAALSRSLGWKGDLVDKGYVRFVQSGTDTLVQVDANGGADSFLTLATLKNVAAASMTRENLSTDVIVSDYTNHQGLISNNPVPAASVPLDTSLGQSTSGSAGNITTAPATPTPVDTGSKPAEDMTWKGLEALHKIVGTLEAETLNGTGQADLIVGGLGNDVLNGGAGDDVLAGGLGKDALFGGAGSDTASYADATAGVTASLKDAAINTGYAAGDKYSQIENLAGSKYDDILHGNDGVNLLNGDAGNDQLFGWGGADTLKGGEGNDLLDGGLRNDVLDGGVGNDKLIGGDGFDTLTGGAGKDVFVLDATFRSSFDTVTDFTAGEDKIGLSGTGLKSLSGVTLEVGPKLVATTGAPTLLYNAVTGALLFDADGRGGHDPVKLAMLDHMPNLHLSDFILI